MKNNRTTSIAAVAIIRPTGPKVVSLLAQRDGLGVGVDGTSDAGGNMPLRVGAAGAATGTSVADPSAGDRGAKKSLPFPNSVTNGNRPVRRAT